LDLPDALPDLRSLVRRALVGFALLPEHLEALLSGRLFFLPQFSAELLALVRCLRFSVGGFLVELASLRLRGDPLLKENVSLSPGLLLSLGRLSFHLEAVRFSPLVGFLTVSKEGRHVCRTRPCFW
jgi:hypothetical protein